MPRNVSKQFIYEKSLFLRKIQVLLNKTIFFVSLNNQILTKVIAFSQSTLKKLPQALWFDFPDISSYLTFKLSTRTRGCTISFELQLSQTLLSPYAKLYQDLPKKEKLQLSNDSDNFSASLH